AARPDELAVPDDPKTSLFGCQTSDGELRFRRSPDTGTSGQDLLLVIPGAFRNAESIAPFADSIASYAGTVSTSLPGFGGSSPLTRNNVASFAENYLEALIRLYRDRRITIVGESLGGLVAFNLAQIAPAGLKARVIALDPPLSTGKLWPVQQVLAQTFARQPSYKPLDEFARDIFGLSRDGAIADLTYFHLLEDVGVPVEVATGTVPLFPVRDPNIRPCLIDQTDVHILSALKHVRVHSIAGADHVLVESAPGECEALVRDAILSEQRYP
ncbi:alpha/beta hydrolase, partial [Phenylobacterium sp.]|uniref:alpha/beta fold hydrolase n=1 Tax=Phenylobacterium sp. TaxID=1871053 RepID=UPI00286D05CB